MINFFPKNIKECDDTIDKLLRENRKLQKEIARLNEIIDRARRFLYLTCYYNERTLTFSECNKLYNMLDKEELKEEEDVNAKNNE